MSTETTNEATEGLKPMLNMLDIQNRTAQKLMREQMNFISECMGVSSQQSDALRDGDDQIRFFRVPLDAGREIGERWNGVLARQWNILLEARDEMAGEAQSMAKNAESTARKASREAESTVRQASETATKAASGATSSSAKAEGAAESDNENNASGSSSGSGTSAGSTTKSESSSSKSTKSGSASNRKSQS
jgi:hypothetical protein